MFPSHQVNATTMAMLPFALGAPASASAPTASDPIRLPLLPMNMAANSHSTGFQSAQVANHSSLGLINSPSEATMLAAANQQLKERLARLQDLVKADEARRLLYDFAARSTINREEPAVLQASNQQAEAPCPFAARSLSKVRTVASERSAIALPEEVKSPKEASQVLNILGTTIRSKSDRFVDASRLPYTKLPPSIRGGICQFFPDKIYKLLEEAEEQGNTDIISFLPHGRAFKVHKLEAFVEGLLPLFFNGQTKWASFSRQLNLYGFLKIAEGPDAGAYYHELFLRGCPNLCRYMRRVGAPTSGIDRRRFKLPEGDDPDFYAMPAVQTEEQ